MFSYVNSGRREVRRAVNGCFRVFLGFLIISKKMRAPSHKVFHMVGSNIYLFHANPMRVKPLRAIKAENVIPNVISCYIGGIYLYYSKMTNSRILYKFILRKVGYSLTNKASEISFYVMKFLNNIKHQINSLSIVNNLETGASKFKNNLWFSMFLQNSS